MDVLIKENIDKIILNYPSNLKVHYMVTKGDSDWSGMTGHITKETLEKCMPKPSADTLIMYCGTKPFNKFMSKTMTELGYSEDMLIKF